MKTIVVHLTEAEAAMIEDDVQSSCNYFDEQLIEPEAGCELTPPARERCIRDVHTCESILQKIVDGRNKR